MFEKEAEEEYAHAFYHGLVDIEDITVLKEAFNDVSTHV